MTQKNLETIYSNISYEIIQNVSDPNEWKQTPTVLKVYKDHEFQQIKLMSHMKWIGDTTADADETQKFH